MIVLLALSKYLDVCGSIARDVMAVLDAFHLERSLASIRDHSMIMPSSEHDTIFVLSTPADIVYFV